MRIGIVNDVAMAREALRRVVTSSDQHEVAWTACDGAEAIELARQNPPDLILMDLLMPGTDGVEATRRIMGESPCAILIVTATVSGHLSKVYQAMGYGALDATDTPTLGPSGSVAGSSMLLNKISVIGRLVGPAAKRQQIQQANLVPQPSILSDPQRELSVPFLVVLGASTGGPQALSDLLSELPRDLDAGFVIVQHVDAAFAPGLGRWLSERAKRPVTVISEGDRSPAPGQVMLSGTDDHLVLNEKHEFHFTPEPSSISYRPSVDVFFQSVARFWPRPGIAVLLTGMGRDGAQGLLTLRKQGWRTIAQDQSSSIVWGMPKAAVEIGAAEQTLPLPLIAEAIARIVRERTQPRRDGPASPVDQGSPAWQR